MTRLVTTEHAQPMPKPMPAPHNNEASGRFLTTDANREEGNGERTRACVHAPRNACGRGGGLWSGCVWRFGEGAGVRHG